MSAAAQRAWQGRRRRSDPAISRRSLPLHGMLGEDPTHVHLIHSYRCTLLLRIAYGDRVIATCLPQRARTGPLCDFAAADCKKDEAFDHDGHGPQGFFEPFLVVV